MGHYHQIFDDQALEAKLLMGAEKLGDKMMTGDLCNHATFSENRQM